MDTAQRLKEVFAHKPGAEELLARLQKFSSDDQHGIFYFLIGSYQATTYEDWAKFHTMLTEAMYYFDQYNARLAAEKEKQNA